MSNEQLIQPMRVLKKTGNLFMMNYPKHNAHLRVRYLDDAAYDVHDYLFQRRERKLNPINTFSEPNPGVGH